MFEPHWETRFTRVDVLETTITLTIQTVKRSLGEVAVATSPDTTSLPVVGDREGPGGPGFGLPAGLDSRDSRADVQVGEDGGPESTKVKQDI